MYCMVLMQKKGATQISLLSDADIGVLEPDLVLHPIERQAYVFLSDFRKDAFLRGRYALKSILCCDIGNSMNELFVTTDGFGKPYVPCNTNVYCSISHTHGYASAAVSTQAAVGVDVEKIKIRHPALLRDISHRSEVDQLLSVYPLENITTILWVIKEAAAKADERIYPMSHYHVSVSDRLFVTRGASQWDVSLTVLSGHVFALAEAV